MATMSPEQITEAAREGIAVVNHISERVQSVRLAPIEEQAREGLAMINLMGEQIQNSLRVDEWEDAFQAYDLNKTGVITRKEWHQMHGSIAMFDAIPKRHSTQISQQEWKAAYEAFQTMG